MVAESILRNAQRISQQSLLRARNLQQQVKAQKPKQSPQINTGVKERVEILIGKLNSGEIKNINEIPTDLRQYINLPADYFQKRTAYENALQQSKEAQTKYNNLVYARKMAEKGLSALYVKDLPKYARDYFREIKQGVRSYAEKQALGVAYFKGGLGYSIAPDKVTSDFKPMVVSETGKPLPSGVQYANRQALESYKPENIKANLPKTQTLISSDPFKTNADLGQNQKFVGITQGRGVVSQAPSQLQDYIEVVRDKGPITGTLFFLGEKAKARVIGKETHPTSYQPYATGNLASLGVQASPYFTPVGPLLMVATGGESIFFKSTSNKGQRPEFQQEISSLEEKGFNPLVSRAITYGTPVSEIVLGGVGLSGQVKTSQIKNAINPQTEFIGTWENVGQGTRTNILAKTSFFGPEGVKFPSAKIVKPKIGEDIFTLGTQIVKPVEKTNRFVSFGRGFNILGKEAKPFVSISKGAERGAGYVVKDTPLWKLRGEIGQGGIVDRSTGLIYRQVGENIYAYSGGKAVLRINRARGRVSYVIKEPSIKGKLINSPEKVLPSDIKILQPSGGKKTSLSKTFQQATNTFISDIQKGAVSQVSKEVTNVKPIISPSITKQSQTSSFFGTGQYERTEGFGSSVLKPNDNILNLDKVRQIDFLSIRSGPKTKNKEEILLKEKNKLHIFQNATPREIQGERIGQKELSLLRTQQQLREKQRTRQTSLLKQTLGEPATKPRIPPLIPFPSSKNTISRIKKEDLSKLYQVFVRRFGKEVKIFEGGSKKKAKEELVKSLIGTLGRSGQIFEGGKPISFEKLNLGKMFRPAKKNQKRIVQKAKYSLGSFGERREIQYFKKKNSKGKNKFW